MKNQPTQDQIKKYVIARVWGYDPGVELSGMMKQQLADITKTVEHFCGRKQRRNAKICPERQGKILKVVCDHFGINEATLKEHTKFQTHSPARKIAIYFLYQAVKNKCAAARVLDRDHSSTYEALDAVEISLKTKTYLYNDLVIIQKKLSA